MTWVAPLAGAILAAVVIPPLILLYFLKLRRRTQSISCTLLWKRSVEDLRANAPFQRLRRSLLLFLQLLALILLALAIMQPRILAGRQTGGKVVLIIDNSASMTATDGPNDTTRLDEAKRLARARIEEMHAGGLFSRAPGETMIVAFSDRAEIVSRFTSSKQQLLDSIERIRPTHGETRIADALKLARAYTTNVNPDDLVRPVGEPATIELYSDGRIEDLEDQVIRGERITYRPIGSAEADNIAIGAISVERPYDRPMDVQVFASLLNYNRGEVSCDVQLSIDGNVSVGGIVSSDIPPAVNDPASGRLVPGRSNVVYAPFELPRGATIEIRNLRNDDLDADNTAQIVVPPPKQLRVAVVPGSRNPPLLLRALEGLNLQSLEGMSPARYERLAEQDGIDQYDVIVLDNFAPPVLAPGRYLSFGPTPPLEGLNEYGIARNRRILDVRQDHPVMRFVNFDNVLIGEAKLIQPADDVNLLAEISTGSAITPVIVEVSRPRVHLIHLTFDWLESSLPLERSFPTFIFNAIDYLGHFGDAMTTDGLAPGDVITTRLPATVLDIELRGPGGLLQTLEPVDPTALSWGPIRLAGLHVLSWTEPGVDGRQMRAFASNLLSESEGVIAPAPQITMSQDVIAGAEGEPSTYTSLWPWAIGLTLLVTMLEWWVYHKKTWV